MPAGFDIPERVRNLWRNYVWPPLLEPEPLPGLADARPSNEITFDLARAMLDGQYRTYESLDTKAATVMGGLLVLIGLIVPDLHPSGAIHTILVIPLAVVLAHSLLTAFRGFSVSKIEYGVTPESLMILIQVTPDETRTALTVDHAQSIARNQPRLLRKAMFIQCSLRSLVIAPIFIALLFVSGGFATVNSAREQNAGCQSTSAAEASRCPGTHRSHQAGYRL